MIKVNVPGATLTERENSYKKEPENIGREKEST